MRTDKQREASRSNGSRSNGPVTPEGKTASSKNSFKLGICISDGAFYEDPDSRRQITQLLSEYGEFYQPRSPFERDALEEIALCRVRLSRLQRVEEGLYTEGKERAFVTDIILGPDGKPIHRYELGQYPPEERPVVADMHLAAAWRPVHDLFESLSRQETRLSNRLRRAQQRFDELVKTRKNEQKNEPKPDLTPVAATPESEVGQAPGLPAAPSPAPATPPEATDPVPPLRKGPNTEAA